MDTYETFWEGSQDFKKNGKERKNLAMGSYYMLIPLEGMYLLLAPGEREREREN